MFPSSSSWNRKKPRIPRASGGVSVAAMRRSKMERYSPRKRGCFSAEDRSAQRALVFPAQAGVFPWRRFGISSTPSIPRASGGVSIETVRCGLIAAVFPAQAGVFPMMAMRSVKATSIPRASGGVSGDGEKPYRVLEYSPRKRGCFRHVGAHADHGPEFPA